MNEKLFSILRDMLPCAESKQLPWNDGANLEQIHFFTMGRECSITDFSNLSETELAEMKKTNKFDNDVQWLGNVRFSATSN